MALPRAGSAILAMLTLAACDEMRRPQAGAAPPAGLVAPSADPVRDAMNLAVDDFIDQGRKLQGNPTRAARAAARLEYVAEAAPGWGPISPSIVIALRGARSEVRSALAADPDASPRLVMQALVAASNALARGDRAAAASALPAPLFRGGGEAALRLLEQPGPLPYAEQATALLVQESARIDAEQRWYGTQAAPDTGVTSGGTLTEGLGRGY
ncbi:hypothetical protein GXW71_02930 [Roseomonas hellenica]|uniref:Lipoprotein n=1 Tax=Plastoroseomonas hellenica TaxID=2687306 RepID=A0ABS5ESM3_9PROT|nr:hypothetical protein [Plastoroseomonas hellenica]MBR0663302.1 hypothetical protein [Plastoroseomonas hellenica]